MGGGEPADEVVLVDACRIPVGRVGGYYRHTRADDLLALVFSELVQRTGLPTAAVDEVMVGCAQQSGEQSFNVGRSAWLQAGLPVEVPAFTLDAQSGSGQQVLTLALRSLRSGLSECVVAAGVDVSTRSALERPWHETAGRPGHPVSRHLLDRYRLTSQGRAAEQVAAKWGIGREELDGFGVESHRRTMVASALGKFTAEILDVGLPDGSLAYRDEGPKPDFTLEQARALPPTFGHDGRLTTAHVSPLADGAAVALLCTRRFAERNGLPVRAEIRHAVTVGSDPELMLTAVMPATQRLLAHAGVGLADVEVFEVDESSAPVVLAWQREFQADPARVNPNGGAIALGEAPGPAGVRLLSALVSELERRGGGLGVQTMSAGLGIGLALLAEVPVQ